MTHPDLLVYAGTQVASFPLILAIGREPNDEASMDHVVGPYDFDEFPHCAFWNASYSLVAWANGLQTRELKSLCRVRGASPLVYADSLPVPIKNSVLDKASLRRAILAGDVERHVDGVFEHGVTKRLGLVFLSGIDGDVFAGSRERIREHSQRLGVPCIDVPFFYGTNMPRIRETMTPEGRLLLRELFQTFVAASAPPAS